MIFVSKNKKQNSATMKLQAPSLLTVLIFLFLSFQTSTSLLTRGSSLSVEDSSHVLTSPDKTFTCGFYGVGDENAYWFSVWFTNSSDRTVVWMANRDRPVNGQGSKVSLRQNGAMVLTDVDGTVIWMTPVMTNTTSSTRADRAELLDSGNLVLKDLQGKILWQSFDFPTDTLLPNQYLTKSTKLISKLGRGNFGSGFYTFYFDNDNVLRLIYDGPDTSSVYWPNPDWTAFQNGRTVYNSSRIAVLDDMGSFLSSDIFQFSAIDMGFGIKRRLTMDYDGNLRLYSLNVNGSWMVSYEALRQQCNVHGICGRNGICVYAQEPKCSCPPGYEVMEPGNWNKGCKPKFNRTCSNTQQVKFIELPHVDFYGYDLNFSRSVSLDSCKKLCLDDCRCEAFSYRITGEGLCFTKSVLFNGLNTPNFPGTIYLKLPLNVELSEPTSLVGTDLVCPSSVTKVVIGTSSMYGTAVKRIRWAYLYGFAIAIGAIEVIFFVAGWWFLFRKHDVPSLLEDGYRVISSQFRRFTYIELKKATKNFKEEVGRGGSGAVYKGVLEDEREVAVKRLGDIYQGEEVFWAEVSTIGKIYHMNLVRMWGFCSEDKHRLLIYEYVKNQSLDRHLFSSDFLGWKERFKVALGTAKGLAYLHHECLEWVIHCDVKPENILLDSQFEPKIADFGLAKLSQRGSKNSEFSRIRGTKGYMAPEWALNLPITAKVDVYSYGVVILEMVKGIRLSGWVVGDGDEEETELKRFVRVVKTKIQCEEDSWIEDVADPRMNGKFSKNQVATLVRIGISCVEGDRSKRPTMDSVVQSMLECEAESEVVRPKEHASYGEITESKAGQGALLLNILSKYSEAFSSMVEGKNEEMSTSELSGGARIHYIFQSIFVKSLEEVDPCEDLTDDDIRTAIQNATGPKSALFVPEVPFEVLIRRQIARLLDPSLQCARFIYDELMKISHRCLVNELQRFPVLRKRMDEVIGNFLREGLEPSETMIGHIIEMEMDYINTSHPNFIGGSKAVEVALQQIKSSKVTLPIARPKDGVEADKAPASERSLKSRAILARQVNGIVSDQGVRPMADVERVTSSGNTTGSSWGISSIFGGSDNRVSAVKESTTNRPYSEPVHNMEHALSMIHLREPPTILRPSDSHSEHEAIEIAVTKSLLRSYYDIVRKNIEDSIPKAIMHFLVNHTKRELHNVFIKKLYRENLFEEMLQEPEEVATKRKRTRDTLRVLQQAFRTLDELPLEAESVERGYSVGADPTGLPKIHGLPSSSVYSTSSGSLDSYSASPRNTRSRKSSHSGELQSHFYANADSNGSGRTFMPGLYPSVDL